MSAVRVSEYGWPLLRFSAEYGWPLLRPGDMISVPGGKGLPRLSTPKLLSSGGITDGAHMDTRRSFGRLFNRIAAAARRWAAQLHPRPAEATIPPLQPVRLLAEAEPIPADPAEHAVQFAEDWYDRLEFHSRRRMRELGIPEHRIGAYDIDYDFRHAAFHPKERTGGSNSPGALNLNSGILNPELLSPELGPKVAAIQT